MCINLLHQLIGKNPTDTFLSERLAHIASGVAIIYVEAPFEVEMKDRVDDVVCAIAENKETI